MIGDLLLIVAAVFAGWEAHVAFLLHRKRRREASEYARYLATLRRRHPGEPLFVNPGDVAEWHAHDGWRPTP